MTRRLTWAHLLLVSFFSSGATLLLNRLISAEPVLAQSGSGPLQGVTVFAGARRDTEKDESFIFVTQDGDIWVYRNEDFAEHYRIAQLGQPLQKVPRK